MWLRTKTLILSCWAPRQLCKWGSQCMRSGTPLAWTTRSPWALLAVRPMSRDREIGRTWRKTNTHTSGEPTLCAGQPKRQRCPMGDNPRVYNPRWLASSHLPVQLASNLAICLGEHAKLREQGHWSANGHAAWCDGRSKERENTYEYTYEY